MLTVVSLMVLGMGLGFLFRKGSRVLKKLDTWITWTIYVLLFVLGLSVGKNDTIVQNIHVIGMKALIITLAAIAGSIFVCWFVFLFFFRSRKGK